MKLLRVAACKPGLKTAEQRTLQLAGTAMVNRGHKMVQVTSDTSWKTWIKLAVRCPGHTSLRAASHHPPLPRGRLPPAQPATSGTREPGIPRQGSSLHGATHAVRCWPPAGSSGIRGEGAHNGHSATCYTVSLSAPTAVPHSTAPPLRMCGYYKPPCPRNWPRGDWPPPLSIFSWGLWAG